MAAVAKRLPSCWLLHVWAFSVLIHSPDYHRPVLAPSQSSCASHVQGTRSNYREAEVAAGNYHDRGWLDPELSRMEDQEIDTLVIAYLTIGTDALP